MYVKERSAKAFTASNLTQILGWHIVWPELILCAGMYWSGSTTTRCLTWRGSFRLRLDLCYSASLKLTWQKAPLSRVNIILLFIIRFSALSLFSSAHSSLFLSTSTFAASPLSCFNSPKTDRQTGRQGSRLWGVLVVGGRRGRVRGTVFPERPHMCTLTYVRMHTLENQVYNRNTH